MAKVHEEVIVITLSKLVKNDEAEGVVATEELVSALASVAEELAGAGIVVEANRA